MRFFSDPCRDRHRLSFSGPIVTSIDAQKFSVEEDLEYARGLMNRRMHDIAKATLDAIIDNPDASSGEKASANLEIANLYKDKFRRGLTYQERIDASEAADRAYQDFITNFSDPPHASSRPRSTTRSSSCTWDATGRGSTKRQSRSEAPRKKPISIVTSPWKS